MGDLDDDDGCITSDNFPLDADGGEDERAESTCIFSSLWFVGDGAVDDGERVAMGGSAIDEAGGRALLASD